jgi:hypothetical protein
MKQELGATKTAGVQGKVPKKDVERDDSVAYNSDSISASSGVSEVSEIREIKEGEIIRFDN